MINAIVFSEKNPFLLSLNSEYLNVGLIIKMVKSSTHFFPHAIRVMASPGREFVKDEIMYIL